MKTLHIVTGATGFVGGALVLRLLQETSDDIWCGVRPKKGLSEEARLHDALRHAANVYGQQSLHDAIQRRVHALAFDLCEASLAEVPALPKGSAPVFWHSAASLRYEEQHKESIFRENVAGTANALALARACGVARFNYISTAYVAGTRTGMVTEELAALDSPTSNCYERSKSEAEHLVWNEGRMETRILRPSIVIGHSETLAATSFTGLYGFLRELHSFRRRVKRQLGAMLDMRPLSVMVDSGAPINFIPVDSVVSDAVQVGLAETELRIFHLTNDAAPAVGNTLDLLFDELGLPRPRHVRSARAFTSVDRKLDDQLVFYGSYMNSEKVFARTHTDAIVGAGRGNVPLPDAAVRRFARWYLDEAMPGRMAA